MQVKCIAECSKGSILQYFRPSISYHLSLRPLCCLFFSGCLRQFYCTSSCFEASPTMSILTLSVFSESTIKPVLNGHSKGRQKIGLQDRLSLNAGQKYCRMLQGEHSTILSTFIKLPFVVRPLICLFFSGRFRQFYCTSS